MSTDSLRTNKDIVARVEQLLQAAYEEKPEFNAALNGIAPIEIPSLNVEQAPYSLEASEVLFWVDRDAYNNELSFWETAHALETHQEAIDLLRAKEQQSVFQDLVVAIKRYRVAPFIGAGMSCDCKLPLWGAALEQMAKKIDGIDLPEVQDCISKFEYLKVAQVLWEKDAYQVKNFIRSRFAEGRIENGTVKGPISLLPRFSHGCIITTNLDPVVEMVIGRGNLEGYMHGMQQGNKFVSKLIKGDRCILKLHGDAEDHDSYVFTAQQYEQAYGSSVDFTKPLPRALRQIFCEPLAAFPWL
jgi:hypothetical protein